MGLKQVMKDRTLGSVLPSSFYLKAELQIHPGWLSMTSTFESGWIARLMFPMTRENRNTVHGIKHWSSRQLPKHLEVKKSSISNKQTKKQSAMDSLKEKRGTSWHNSIRRQAKPRRLISLGMRNSELPKTKNTGTKLAVALQNTPYPTPRIKTIMKVYHYSGSAMLRCVPPGLEPRKLSKDLWRNWRKNTVILDCDQKVLPHPQSAVTVFYTTTCITQWMFENQVQGCRI